MNHRADDGTRQDWRQGPVEPPRTAGMLGEKWRACLSALPRIQLFHSHRPLHARLCWPAPAALPGKG